MKTTQYLDAAKKALGIDSDYALAPHLELTRQAVSKLRNGHLVMSNTTAARIAGILQLDPIKVIADAELERGSNDLLWRRIRDAAGFAFALVGGYLLFSELAAVSELTVTGLWLVGSIAPATGGQYTLCAIAAALLAAIAIGAHLRDRRIYSRRPASLT